ncbi:MAG: hypothetical protein K1X74_05175 [Pirellulales bacterium]|nr:hypothetical protein [Pirellulales bacterium]
MSTPGVTLLVLAIAGGVLLLAAGVGAFVYGLLAMFAGASGWRGLAKDFPLSRLPPRAVLHGQSLRVGAVRYKRCATLGADGQGLYLAVPLPRHQPLLIPWSAVVSTAASRFWGSSAVDVTLRGSQAYTIRVPIRAVQELPELARRLTATAEPEVEVVA